MNLPYRFLFLMDAYDTLNLETETSLALMTELLIKGHRVFWIEESGLSLRDGKVYGAITEVVQVAPFEIAPFKIAPFEHTSLEDFDAFLIRKDPPFNEHYLHLTLLLDFLPDSLLQFNSVAALRNFNEKLLPLRWPKLTPPTLVTSCADQIMDFLTEHQTIILKPLNDCSGRGIKRFKIEDSALNEIKDYLDSLTTASPIVMAQKFIPEVKAGDKRVYLVNGEPLGWVNRIPKSGHYLANIHQGARCEATSLTEFELKAIETISPFIIENGIYFAGLDFIGDYLTEINITSPSAIRQINNVMNEKLEVRLVESMLMTLDNSNSICAKA